MWFRKKKVEEGFERPDAPAEVTVRAIGYVRNEVAKPRPRGWEKVRSVIAVLPEHEGKLAGLDGYGHVLVLFLMDLAADAPEKPETLTLASGRTYGIFATRSQLRPNHLGVSAVALQRVEGCEVEVLGLDAINGTAVLDIKPYLPEYDAHPGARIPGG
jgi:tRNA (adenine37-N6)-methyltransferase